MTIGELKRELDKFHDAQFVCVGLVQGKGLDLTARLAVQEIRALAPTHDPAPDGSNFLVMLRCHEENAKIT